MQCARGTENSSLSLPSPLSPGADMQESVAHCKSRHCSMEEGERQTDSSRHSICHNCHADISRTHTSRIHRPLPLLLRPLLVLLLTLLSILPATAAPSRCSQPPPSPNCRDSFPFGQYFYYNASSPTHCLRFFHWGCEGDNVFMTEQECLETCDEGEGEGGEGRGMRREGGERGGQAGRVQGPQTLACCLEGHPLEWLASSAVTPAHAHDHVPPLRQAYLNIIVYIIFFHCLRIVSSHSHYSPHFGCWLPALLVAFNHLPSPSL